MKNRKQAANQAATNGIQKKPTPSKSIPAQIDQAATRTTLGTPSQDEPGARKASRGGPAKSKQERILAMLRLPAGATVASIMKLTGWQKHSVHGFFAGVVRKRLRLNLTSKKGKGQRIYRITDGNTRKRNKADKAAGRAA